MIPLAYNGAIASDLMSMWLSYFDSRTNAFSDYPALAAAIGSETAQQRVPTCANGHRAGDGGSREDLEVRP